MLCIVLDEGISPSISPRLWAEGVDNYPLRDRGLLGSDDHEVWARANAEDRAVVTINGIDFRPFARVQRKHSGLMVIPSGGTRDDHFELVMRGVDKARKDCAIIPSFRNKIFDVRVDGTVEVETTALVGAEHDADVVTLRSGRRRS